MADVLDRCRIFRNSEFYPVMNIITAITNSNPAVITTKYPHNYITGIIARLNIPPADGMQQANQLVGTITHDSNTMNNVTFSIDIDTTNFDTFAIPMAQPPLDPEDIHPNLQICAQVVPIGEVNSQLTAAVQNILP